MKNLSQFVENYFTFRPLEVELEQSRARNLRTALFVVFVACVLLSVMRGTYPVEGEEVLSLRYMWPPVVAAGVALLFYLLIIAFPRQLVVEIISYFLFLGVLLLSAFHGGYKSLYVALIPIFLIVNVAFLPPYKILVLAGLGAAFYVVTGAGQSMGWLPGPIMSPEYERPALVLTFGVLLILGPGVLATLISQAILTRRQQAERGIRSYRSLVDIAPDPIIVWDPKANITMTNKATVRALGYSSESELAGKPGAYILPEDKYEEGTRILREQLKFQEPRITEFEFLCKDGRRAPVELHLSPIKENDRVIAILGICRDLSERYEEMRRREALQERIMLQDKMASLGRLVLGISHEYNNIFAGLRGYAQLAQIPGKENRLRELPDVTIDLVDRAQNITEGLLTFSEKFEPYTEQVSPAEVINGILRLFRKDFERVGIETVVEVPEDVRLITDGSKLQQLLLTLISNARDAMKNGGKLRINYYEEENQAIIEIGDEGEGIHPDVLPHVFDPFFTTKGPIASGDGLSVGLGLSITYNVVRGLGGNISIDSNPGEGTSVQVQLPKNASGVEDKSKEPRSEEENRES